MTGKGFRKVRKLNNDGAALVIVIVVVAFISIIVTLILYLAGMNFQMKATDYQTKVSFYNAEVPLEELQVQLAVDTSQASKKAYKQVMQQYGGLGSADLREAEYKKVFFEEITAIWSSRLGGITPTSISSDDVVWCTGIHQALHVKGEYHIVQGACSVAGCSKAYHIKLDTLGAEKRLDMDNVNNRILLRGLQVTYTDSSFSSVISTDFCITIPQIDWSVNSYSPDWVEGATTGRKEIQYEECVAYLNYEKQ